MLAGRQIDKSKRTRSLAGGSIPMINAFKHFQATASTLELRPGRSIADVFLWALRWGSFSGVASVTPTARAKKRGGRRQDSNFVSVTDNGGRSGGLSAFKTTTTCQSDVFLTL